MVRKCKKVRGRAFKRILYNRRFSNIVVGAKKKSPNWNAGRKVETKWETKKLSPKKVYNKSKFNFCLENKISIYL